MAKPMRLINTLPALVLGSPIHPVMSSRYLILEFHGHRSGRLYRVPVAYASGSDGLILSTDSSWWRNFVDPAKVSLRWRGRTVAAVAEVVTDRRVAERGLRQLVETVPGYWRPAGMPRPRGGVQHAALRGALDAGRRVIRVRVSR